MMGLLADTWKAVNENDERLNSCKLHHFEQVRGEGTPIATILKYRCKHCGGHIATSAYIMYQKGLEHGEQLPKLRRKMKTGTSKRPYTRRMTKREEGNRV